MGGKAIWGKNVDGLLGSVAMLTYRHAVISFVSVITLRTMTAPNPVRSPDFAEQK
jgi:hypothetical protein